ncbi:hypothetical protein HK405_013854, partial [Cladochytrium tenue]
MDTAISSTSTATAANALLWASVALFLVGAASLGAAVFLVLRLARPRILPATAVAPAMASCASASSSQLVAGGSSPESDLEAAAEGTLAHQPGPLDGQLGQQQEHQQQQQQQQQQQRRRQNGNRQAPLVRCSTPTAASSYDGRYDDATTTASTDAPMPIPPPGPMPEVPASPAAP